MYPLLTSTSRCKCKCFPMGFSGRGGGGGDDEGSQHVWHGGTEKSNQIGFWASKEIGNGFHFRHVKSFDYPGLCANDRAVNPKESAAPLLCWIVCCSNIPHNLSRGTGGKNSFGATQAPIKYDQLPQATVLHWSGLGAVHVQWLFPLCHQIFCLVLYNHLSFLNRTL